MKSIIQEALTAVRAGAAHNRAAGARYRRLALTICSPEYEESAQMCRGAEMAYAHCADILDKCLALCETLEGGGHVTG